MPENCEPVVSSRGGGKSLHRLILWLSLAGMVLAVHLWIQKARGFDQGCLGLSKPPEVQAGCTEVSALPSSHLFGVSNAAWGYAFYFALALISFAKIVTPSAWARRLHIGGEIAVVGALLYSVYLVATMAFVAQAYCVLCLLSALLVATLFGLHVALRRQGGFVPLAESERPWELGLACGALFGAMGLLVGVVLFVNRLGTRPLDHGASGREFEELVGRSLPVFIEGARLDEMRACRFDAWAPVLDLNQFIGAETPFLGRADGVPVIVFYDPNCPHCAVFHAEFLETARWLGDRARFYVLPRSLWELSALQTQALKLAEKSGKYFEVWQRMFARQQPVPRGMTLPEIAALFREAGLDAENLEKRLEAVKPEVLAARRRAVDGKVTGLPAIYIDGRRVLRPNYSADCIGKLVQRVRENAEESEKIPPQKLR